MKRTGKKNKLYWLLILISERRSTKTSYSVLRKEQTKIHQTLIQFLILLWKNRQSRTFSKHSLILFLSKVLLSLFQKIQLSSKSKKYKSSRVTEIQIEETNISRLTMINKPQPALAILQILTVQDFFMNIYLLSMKESPNRSQ